MFLLFSVDKSTIALLPLRIVYLGVNATPQVQLMQPDPLPRQYNEAVLEDGVIGGILNLDLDPSVPDEPL